MTAPTKQHWNDSAGRPDRIEAKMKARYAEATTELDRVAVLIDYLRAAAKHALRHHPTVVDMALADASRNLKGSGDRILAAVRRAA